MVKKINYLLLILALIFTAKSVFAQDEDFFDDSDPGYVDEPEDYDMQPPPSDFYDNQNGNSFVPPPVRPTGNSFSKPKTNSGSNQFGKTTGAVEFRLVDPPKYWKKRPKPKLPAPKSN